ncbi:O-methyltransferase [Streptomyces purpureus]|uniref:O-methyltransferase n=1 Tax=Streptomyces purpureus TaxID=1951 RepID=A0A918GYY7_9ACTN|nr:class I SAM-dependent methyltransferase [Streptomyces purpureus]GGT17720.1 O-methyltransferase [Streptomyces purpureus]
MGATEPSEGRVKTVDLTPEIYGYLVAQAEPATEVQLELAARTERLGRPARMRVPHEQAVFLTLLVRLLGARRVVEVGTFTGYSTLAFAMGLAPGGTVLTCDLSEEWTQIAEEAWHQAGVADRVELRLGPAAETLRSLPAGPEVDLVFLDADKSGYIDYWEQLVPRVRPGGLLLADNTLWGGAAADRQATGDGAAIRAFNAHVRADDRVESVLLPLADGLTFARRL